MPSQETSTSPAQKSLVDLPPEILAAIVDHHVVWVAYTAKNRWNSTKHIRKALLPLASSHSKLLAVCAPHLWKVSAGSISWLTDKRIRLSLIICQSFRDNLGLFFRESVPTHSRSRPYRDGTRQIWTTRANNQHRSVTELVSPTRWIL